MVNGIEVKLKNIPVLDSGFVPGVLWNRAYRRKIREHGKSEKIIIALERNKSAISKYETEILPHTEAFSDLNTKYVERIMKFLLWMKGGATVYIAGNNRLADEIRKTYAPGGEREFDYNIMGEKIYGKKLEVIGCAIDKAPESKEPNLKLGGNWNGCRIGFDLGGSDRKCAAVIDGKVVFTEEVKWSPYFQKDPQWHKEGINDSLKKAAAKLPRVDAIGGSSAGVYVNNQVRVASLFRGVSENDFNKHIRNIFLDIQKEWNNIPFVVVNDGEVTALAGAMEMNDNSVLGISMGTSQAGGYVNPDGNITDWLNELAFAPVDYRENAPADEWSGDKGCGVQYFSQQAIARLAPLAGISLPDSQPLAERLVHVQQLMEKEDPRARKIYETIGTYFGYTVAHYADFYKIRNLLILGRVTSGTGGSLIISEAENVLKNEFPEIKDSIRFRTPDEKTKRHGQAVVAASLPKI